MIERDFFMRQISLLAQALAKVLFHKKKYEYPQAKKEIDGACKSLLGVGSDFVRQFSDVQLIEMFGKDVETTGVKYYILGLLLKEEAEIHHGENHEEESLLCFEKSLSLLLSAFNNRGAPIEPEHPAKINEVVHHLQVGDVPANVKEKLFAFYEFTGRYDKAEDVLFDLVAYDAQSIERGMEFYGRLLKKSEEDLTNGGLPRNEVIDGMRSLKERKLV